MVDIGTILRHYKREDVRGAMVASAKDREVAVKYGEQGFGKRPDALTYPKDILEFAKQGASSFHVSEEHWSKVFQLSTELRREDLDDLRIGWDLVLDIDCHYWEYSKLTAQLLIQALKEHGVKSISCKFSGNKGFHIGVPFQAFPKKLHGKDTRLYFPEGARRIAGYLAEFIRIPLAKEILKRFTVEDIIKTTGKSFDEIVKQGKFDPFSVIEIDTLLISSRHLYRMVYSLHEKSGLCSVPIELEQILSFEKKLAEPGNVQIGQLRFLDTTNTVEGEAAQLLIQAFDFIIPEEKVERKNSDREFETLTTAAPKDFFPPCIHNILVGLEDGRKRSMFVLINFLSNVGYGYDAISDMVVEWNTQNKEPLREVLLKGQVRYRRVQKGRILPPNCDNKAYYQDLRVCAPDSFCRKIKNPVNYTIVRTRLAQPRERGVREKLTEEQKAMRRKFRGEQRTTQENASDQQ
jgi:hypothetical protein